MRDRQNWKESFSKRLVAFSVTIIPLAGILPKSPAGYAIAGQIVRSATSIVANFQEAQDASSLKDFIQRMSISLREARETAYWLQVLTESNLAQAKDTKVIIAECNEIISIFVSSIKSAKAKL